MKIAREAWPIALPLGAAAVVAGAVVDPWLALPFAVAGAFTLWFFRDPEREAPPGNGAILAPADGRILRAGPGGVSIFMNVFDVHVCRSPLGGRVQGVEHRPGRFLAAYRDDAAEHNERVAIVVTDGDREVRFVLVAGLIARRIVCKVAPGQLLRAGERIGLIRFGSRVDVALPASAEPLVAVGARVRAGETVLARVGAA
jgi:phosphatidylserine decarboxylase